MMDARDIILAPVITEKSSAALSDKKYTFRVADGANKIEIAKAVEEIFGVKVAKVNTISMKGKKRRYGRFEGYTSDWKKAVVTLTAESKTIEFFNGMF
ncbi:MAG: 50S ribosomal protein L23 [Pseudoflavonifractor sp.]|nr:50S ribosomal protein L23 [Pseudoflavonifractor sp.]